MHDSGSRGPDLQDVVGRVPSRGGTQDALQGSDPARLRMAKIKNCTLPPAITEQLLREIELLPEPDVLTYGQQFLPGGFTKARAIRERLAGMVQGPTPLPPVLISLLN